jgi:hypothetical protein
MGGMKRLLKPLAGAVLVLLGVIAVGVASLALVAVVGAN